MAQDRTDGTEPLWATLGQLEDAATALHEQVDDLFDDAPIPNNPEPRTHSGPEPLDYYTGRYGLGYDDGRTDYGDFDYVAETAVAPVASPAPSELISEPDIPSRVRTRWQSLMESEAEASIALDNDLQEVDERLCSLAQRLGVDQKVDGDPADGDPVGVVSAPKAAPRVSPASFRQRLGGQDMDDSQRSARVTSAFHNVVYGLEGPEERESLLSLLERRAFDELWAQGAHTGDDHFIEFFASEGFGRPHG